MIRRVIPSLVIALSCAWAWDVPAVANPCSAPTFAFGNAGFGAGACAPVACAPRPACGPSIGVCGPWSRGRWSVGGWPDSCGGWWGGWPRWGAGGCGWGRWRGCESIFFSTPYGGSTFFSGCAVPFVPGWPMTWYPGVAVAPYGWYPQAAVPFGVAPQFGPAGIVPFLGAAPATGAGSTAATTARAVTPRRVNAAARKRAERLVATGDRRLRAARAGAVADARAAADAYRRAAAAAPDDPDIRIREALALVALGDADAADTALARAVAIDGRLGGVPARRDDVPPDPVFGDRPADAPAPLAARGRAILADIGAGEAAGVAWLAARWNDRWAGATSAVASR